MRTSLFCGLMMLAVTGSAENQSFREKVPVYGVVKPGAITTLIAINNGIVSQLGAPLGTFVKAGSSVIDVLEKETIRSYRTAINGKVAKMHVTSGAAITPGMPLVTVIDEKQKEVEISLSPREALKIKVGTVLEMRDSGEQFGKISRISPLVDPDTGAILAFVNTAKPLANYIGDVISLSMVVREITECKVVALNQVQDLSRDYKIEAVSGDSACLRRRPASAKK